MNENGFTDGGQLGALDGVKLAELLGVDGLLYSELLQFTQINLAFYLERRVEIAARLIDGKSGEKLWSDQQKRSTVIMVTDRKSAERVFAKGMAVRWMEKAIRRPLEPEIEMTVDALFDSLPFNHFQGFYSKEVVP
ncbi:MAG: hypothetical protein COV48_10105 [Elusimicrobia bacterium CG11_big_fil_rev_8_21_14_0_20_64_6]|nr:MAG: hypothetical protein COV48_10105 [Elusimicrobia bacterium CG11_big_fil_rev_8_21_14_0_20_64_6]